MPEYFSLESGQMREISRRVEELGRWLKDNAPTCELSQKHLDQGSTEQAYWHFGYLCALRDVVSMMNRRLTD